MAWRGLIYILLLSVYTWQSCAQQIQCSNLTTCAPTFEETSIMNCCLLPHSRAFSTSASAEGCTSCYVYGWVKNVTDDFTSAEPQPQNITASEGEEITLTLFFAKNDPLNGNLYIFEIHTSGSAVVNEDYTISATDDIRLRSDPVLVTVNLLIDRVADEGMEDITLTLVQDDRTESASNQFLLYDTVHITLLDRDECAGLNNISNGYVKVNSLKINATAIYSCDDGFVLVGESIRVCEDDLTWSGEVPTCLVSPTVVCSKEADCSNEFSSDSVESCCVTEGAQSYRNGTHPGTCSLCHEKNVICSKKSDCSGEYLVSDSVESCCALEEAESYSQSGKCVICPVNVDDGKTSSDSNVILPAVLVPLLLLVLVIFVSVAIIVTVVYINRRKNTKHNQYSIDNPAVPQSDQH